MCSASKDHHKQSLSISPLHHHQHRRITVHATGNSTAITSPSEISRRQLFAATVAATTLLASRSQPLPALALPLAPLGKASSQIGGEKLTGLTPQQVADILARNLREGEYFITGDLTPEIFDDSCRFKDPTNDIVGLSRYVKALGILFDPGFSAVRLKVGLLVGEVVEGSLLRAELSKFTKFSCLLIDYFITRHSISIEVSSHYL